MKNIKFEKHDWGQSARMTLFDKVSFYAGRADRWGISMDYCHYDRALTMMIFNLYMGVEVWHEDL